MSIFSGKKVLCFIALPHHNRFLVPIMDALKREGMEVVYFTVPAEGAFEITLNQANMPYRHMLDYATAETKERTAGAYRELAGVLQKKILSNRVLQSVPLVIEDKVVRAAVESFYCLESMLQTEKPDLLFALHELNPWGKILGYLSHVYAIPYFTLQEGLYYGDLHYYRFHTDYSTACIVWGEECREILMKAGCGADKIFPLGNTHIWEAKRSFTDPAAIAATRAALGIENGKKVLLFLMSHSNYRPFDAQPFARWMKNRGDVTAVFKWHPVTRKEIIDGALEKMRGNPSIISVSDFDTYALIGASDVCITVGNSTTGLETLAFGKPLMEVRLPDQAYSFVEQGVAEPVVDFADMGGKFERILANGLDRERAANIEKYLEHNFAHRDERTCARIVNLVGEALGAKREEERSPLRPTDEVRFPCSIVLPVDDSPLETLLATLEGIAAHTPAELFEVLIVNCAALPESRELVSSLSGDVKVIEGEAGWSYAQACNRAAVEARGRGLLFLKAGVFPAAGWLEALLQAAEENPDAGVVGGQVLTKNGLLWHVGFAFDVNQSPFSVYRMLPPEFSGASKEREFKAVQFPFLVSRELFCRLGGFNAALYNRFEDVDFCLRVRQADRRVLYTPKSKLVRHGPSWEAPADQEQTNRIRFYSTWSGSLWQDDGRYLEQDGLSHDGLSALYRELAGRLVQGVKELAL
jgi:GT2 family glycosyltransferase